MLLLYALPCFTVDARRLRLKEHVLTPQPCHDERHDQCLHATSRIKIVAFHQKNKCLASEDVDCLYDVPTCRTRSTMCEDGSCIKNQWRNWWHSWQLMPSLKTPINFHLQSIGTASHRKTLFSSGIPSHACPRSLTLTADHSASS